MGISDRYSALLDKVEKTCLSSGRDAKECLLLCVSKTTDNDGVAQAIDAGARDFGENRPDQLLMKSDAFPDVRWHFIGNIQSRRIPDIVSRAHLIHSLHKVDHAEKIDRAAAKIGKVQDVLIEVNVSGEESKSGIDPQIAQDFVEACIQLDNVRVRGLMTMAPQGDPELARDTFERLHTLKDDIVANIEAKGLAVPDGFDQLSMGMSEDWEEAISQGSTIVRLGRAIFSEDF